MMEEHGQSLYKRPILKNGKWTEYNSSHNLKETIDFEAAMNMDFIRAARKDINQMKIKDELQKFNSEEGERGNETTKN